MEGGGLLLRLLVLRVCPYTLDIGCGEIEFLENNLLMLCRFL
jgi:hypothetical protein